MHEHIWTSKNEFKAAGYSQCKGDWGPIDVVPTFSVIHDPQRGDICLSCGQINGEPEGTKDQELLQLQDLIASFQ